MNPGLQTDNQAAFNQSGKITDVLGMMRILYINSMLTNNYEEALKALTRIHSIISPKLKEESKNIDEQEEEIYILMNQALLKYQYNGRMFYRNPDKKRLLEKKLEKMFRELELLQDKYGYGMGSKSDPSFAILEH